MSERLGGRAKRSLDTFVAVDPESLPVGTDPRFTFHYVDISALANGRLILPRDPVEYRHAPSRARRVIRSGDVLMAAVRPNLKAFAYCDLPDGGFVASTGFAVLRPKQDTDPHFILCAILSDDVSRQIESRVVGSNYPAINSSDVRRLELPDLDLVEQLRVGRIVATIDDAIELTEALIAKTQQIKAGLMHDLFTRGVTPDGQLRPPRSEAPQLYKESPLGWISKEWEVARLAEVAEIRTGIAKNASRVFAKPLTVQYLRVANVQDGFLDLSEMKTIDIEASDLERYQVLPGDVLMNEGGDLDKLGRGAIWPGSTEPCVHQNHVFVVRCGARIGPSFLDAWTASPVARRYFTVAGKQTTNLASINKTQLGRLTVLIPTAREQSAIARALEAQESQLLSEAEANAKLRRLKSGLMHDLLTGRVRVAVADVPGSVSAG